MMHQPVEPTILITLHGEDPPSEINATNIKTLKTQTAFPIEINHSTQINQTPTLTKKNPVITAASWENVHI